MNVPGIPVQELGTSGRFLAWFLAGNGTCASNSAFIDQLLVNLWPGSATCEAIRLQTVSSRLESIS